VISPKLVLRSENQIELGCHRIPSPSLEEFYYLHPPIEGFPEKTISTPNPWEFPQTMSPGSKTFQQSKAKVRKNPITPWLSENGKAKKNHYQNLEKFMTPITMKPNTYMHIPWMEKPSRKSYMQPITYKYSC